MAIPYKPTSVRSGSTKRMSSIHLYWKCLSLWKLLPGYYTENKTRGTFNEACRLTLNIFLCVWDIIVFFFMCLKKHFKQKKSFSQNYLKSCFTSLFDTETQILFFRLSAFLLFGMAGRRLASMLIPGVIMYWLPAWWLSKRFQRTSSVDNAGDKYGICKAAATVGNASNI